LLLIVEFFTYDRRISWKMPEMGVIWFVAEQIKMPCNYPKKP